MFFFYLIIPIDVNREIKQILIMWICFSGTLIWLTLFLYKKVAPLYPTILVPTLKKILQWDCRIFFCVAGALTNIQVHKHKTPRHRIISKIQTSNNNLRITERVAPRGGIEHAARCAAALTQPRYRNYNSNYLIFLRNILGKEHT